MGRLPRTCRGTPRHADRSSSHQSSSSSAQGKGQQLVLHSSCHDSCNVSLPHTSALTCEPAQGGSWCTNHSFQAPGGRLAGLKDVKGWAGGWQEVWVCPVALPVVATAGGEAVCGGIGIRGNPLRRPEGRHRHPCSSSMAACWVIVAGSLLVQAAMAC